MDCRGKVAVITGGASGIGKALAIALLEKGAKGIGLFDLNNDLGNTTCRELQTQYGVDRVIFTRGDVLKEEDIEACFQNVDKKYGRLDILCNSAGILDEYEWDKMILINLHGLIRASYLSVPYMGTTYGKNGGVIINVSSLSGVIGGNSWSPVYTASKFGVVGFTRAASNEQLMTENGISMGAICPSMVATGMQSFPKQLDQVREMKENRPISEPFEVANAIIGMIEDKNCKGSVKLQMPQREPIDVPARRLRSLIGGKSRL